MNTGLAGFSQADSAGNWTGLDADFCKALAAATLGDVAKLTDFEDCYRIRVGDHRVGVYIEGDRIEFVRARPRKEFYRLFPLR